MSSTPIIIWDVDDVLNCLMEFWLNHWNQGNNSNISLKDIKENPPHEILGITKETYFTSLDEFRNSESGKYVLANSILMNWFEGHGNKFKHVACTARPIETMPNQAWWIYYNFGQWINTVHAAGAVRDSKIDYQTGLKADFISYIDTEVIFIDDNEENINAVSKIGTETILYPQPWNNSVYSEEEFIEELNNKLGI